MHGNPVYFQSRDGYARQYQLKDTILELSDWIPAFLLVDLFEDIRVNNANFRNANLPRSVSLDLPLY